MSEERPSKLRNLNAAAYRSDSRHLLTNNNENASTSMNQNENKNMQPPSKLSTNSQRNLNLFSSLCYASPAAVPSPYPNLHDRKRKLLTSSNIWFNDCLIEEINNWDDLSGLLEKLNDIDENSIHQTVKENLIVVFDLLWGEIGRRKRGHADEIKSTKIKLEKKDLEIQSLEEEKKQRSEQLDEASREIGNQKANVDGLVEANKELTAENEQHVQHINYLKDMIALRDVDIKNLVHQNHLVKHEKLLEHTQNAVENRRTKEKLGLFMKNMAEVVLVEKKERKSRKKSKSVDKPLTP